MNFEQILLYINSNSEPELNEKEGSREVFESDKNETEKCVVSWLTPLRGSHATPHILSHTEKHTIIDKFRNHFTWYTF